ncbi:hypothetical protein EP164_07910 [Photorhabdus luminescens subsp. sonorensis]|uniref:Uncharacterized protein n=2 Tax=Photorhabdus luminescens TaxID=29488 RepID=A0A5C4RJ99_PHOLU|nr:hypothetical protein C5468_05025 [Photorhabdus luminescens subsp. mexicana]TNH44143.1 hypothetical protein EP164_07910 [Photorhabdus luminescens subsp. sonorensis]
MITIIICIALPGNSFYVPGKARHCSHCFQCFFSQLGCWLFFICNSAHLSPTLISCFFIKPRN